ncbi:MAG: glycerate kinase, partial [Acidimicrobiales bacterium]
MDGPYLRARPATGTMAGMPGPAADRPRLLAAPDKLKGTATASAVAAAVAAGAERAGWEVDRCPLSDGGEGFGDVLALPGDAEHTTTVTGPLGRPVGARWRMSGDQAVLESAAASGLALAGGASGNDPVRATSRGTGELIVAARRAGASRVLVGVGGSATTDG